MGAAAHAGAKLACQAQARICPSPIGISLTAASSARARRERRARRVRALIYVLLVGIIAGLVGWINQAYLKEQWNWYTTMRPYMRSRMCDAYVLNAEAERALKPLASFQECAKDCPEMIVMPAGEFMMGSPATEKGRSRQ